MNIHFQLLAPIYNKVIGQRYPTKLIENCNLEKDNKLLEIGGGTGRFASYFLDKVGEVVVVEPSTKMLQQITKNYPNTIKAVKGVAERLPFEDESFDRIIISDSLHHWKNHEMGLSEAFRVLKKGGCLGIEEIDPKTKWGFLIAVMEKIVLMRSKMFSQQKLEDLCLKVGFIKIEIGWVNKPTYYLILSKK